MYVKIEKQMPKIIHASVQTGLPNLQSCSPRYQIANMGETHLQSVIRDEMNHFTIWFLYLKMMKNDACMYEFNEVKHS